MRKPSLHQLGESAKHFIVKHLPAGSTDRLRTIRAVVPERVRSIDAQAPRPAGAVDVKRLARELSVEELADTADAYYLNNMEAKDHWLAKPFWNVADATDTMMVLGQLLAGLNLSPGMRVLDFGAGSGWMSRMLTQLGCEVVVCDVSPTALELARELYDQYRVLGDKPTPEFLLFDGATFDLPDADIDRVICFGALHHTINPQEVISELGRVLRPGGRAAFAEPGANHSIDPKSQYEMKNYTVIENDILMRSIERWAAQAGFKPPQLAVFSTTPFHLSIDDYERLLAGRAPGYRHLYSNREFLKRRRIFMLHKHGDEMADSRSVDSLKATIKVSPTTKSLPDNEPLRVSYTLTNTGSGRWLPSSAPVGPVQLGVHLYDLDRTLHDLDHHRIDLGPNGVMPGDTIEGTALIPNPGPGSWRLQFDLVSDRVSWFEMAGSTPVWVGLSVEGASTKP